MRKYWIEYTKDFGNTYRLCWTEGNEKPHGQKWERITRKEAEAKAREERNRRKFDPNFSGFADACICKYNYTVLGNGEDYPIIVEVGGCSKS